MKKHVFDLARCFLLLIMFSFGVQAFAQDNVITGTVTDAETNDPLIGVTVMVKGKTAATMTDIDGRYRISATIGDVLTFSFIGLETQEITVGTQTIVNVTLQPSYNVLNEVVAIGYGVVKRSDLTGSVSIVTAEELTKTPTANAAQALQGKATGVLVTQTGDPSETSTIRIRGVGSINSSSDPIFIVDGVRVSSIDGIQPQDIENFQVLKDASATAIYGANGSNGVIIINTKRGTSGCESISVNINSYLTYNRAPKEYDVMNANEYVNFYRAIKGDNAAYSDQFRQAYYGEGWEEGTNWQSLLFRNSISQNHNVTLSGGGNNSNFNVSIGYTNNQGTVLKSSSEAYNIRANSDFKLNKHIKVGENFSARYVKNEKPYTNQAAVWSLDVSPLMKVYNDNYKGGYEAPSTSYYFDGDGILQQGGSGTNAITSTANNDKASALASIMMSDNKSYQLYTNASVYLQIDFTDWLMFKSTPSAGLINQRSNRFTKSWEGNRSEPQAVLAQSYSEFLQLNFENQLLFNKKFNDTHNVQATLVQQVYREIDNGLNISASNFPYENLPTYSNWDSANGSSTLGSSITDYREISYLGRIIYDYKSKYFFTGSVRRDAVSSFAPGHRVGYFSAFSGAWNINQDFLQNVREIDMLKLRVGWGQTGNSNTNGGYYEYYDKITSSIDFRPVFGENQETAYAQYVFVGMAAAEYSWETSEMLNIGFDLNMFKNKLVVAAEYYNKNIDNLLVQVPISSAFGRASQSSSMPWYNLGSLRNRGVEVSVQWRDQITKDLGYGITTNFTTVQNKVISLEKDYPADLNITQVGLPVGSLYGYVSEGIIQNDDDYNSYPLQFGSRAQPGDIKFTDLNNDGVVDSKDRTAIGKTIPGFSYSFGLDVSYKNFDLNVFLNGVADYQIYNQQRANLSSITSQDMEHNKLSEWARNYWTSDNPTTEYVRADLANTNGNNRISSFWIENGSFLRVKDLQLGYSLPKQLCDRINITNARIYANASNLYCFTAYKGRDPEGFVSSSLMSSGTDSGGYALPRSFTFGVQLGF